MAAWRALLRMVFREGALTALALALHMVLLSVAARQLFALPPPGPSPTLLADSIEIVLAETESDVPCDASPTLAALKPVASSEPESAAYLADASTTSLPLPLAEHEPALPSLPELALPPLSLTPAGQTSALPEIAIPPAQSSEGVSRQAEASTGATARIEHPRLTSDLTRLLKRYPPEARRNHWEGTIVLEIEVSAENVVSEARIYRSSGYEVLDRAALRMIRSARFQGGPGTLHQPIEYKLH